MPSIETSSAILLTSSGAASKTTSFHSDFSAIEPPSKSLISPCDMQSGSISGLHVPWRMQRSRRLPTALKGPSTPPPSSNSSTPRSIFIEPKPLLPPAPGAASTSCPKFLEDRKVVASPSAWLERMSP
jgi:hypothetical protein